MIIYKIICRGNGKSYIGQTTQFGVKRWAKHLYHLRRGTHQNKIFQCAFNKYGESSFSYMVIARANSLKDLNILESELIKCHNTLWPSGFNLQGGGDGLS